MHIKNLYVQNVRGVTGEWDTGRAVMIIGDNFRGKTGLLNAIRLAVFGWLAHPRKATQVQPMALASGDNMQVAVRLSDGRKMDRVWTRKANGSVRLEDSSPFALAPAIMLDPKEYFDASPKKRMEYVFKAVRLDKAGFTPEAVLAKVKNISLETNTEASELALKEVAGHVQTSIEESEDQTMQEWIEALLETCTEKQRLAKQNAQRMNQTVAGLTVLETKKPEQFDQEIGAVDAELAQVHQERATLNAERGRLAAAIKERDRRMESHRNNLKIVATETDVLNRQTENQKKVEELVAELEKPGRDFEKEKAELKSRYHVATTEVTLSASKSMELNDQLLNVRNGKRNAQAALDKANAQLEDHDEELAGLLQCDSCPTCALPGVEWRNRVRDKYNTIRAGIVASISDATASLEQYSSKELAVQRELVAHEHDANAKQASKDGLSAERTALNQAESDARLRKSHLQAALRECALIEGGINRSLENIATAKKAVAEFSEIPSDAEAQEKEVLSKLESSADRLIALDNTRKRIIASKASAASQSAAVLERDQSQAELDIWKKTIEIISEFQERMVDAAFGSIMGVANRFSDGILASPLEYRDGEVGRVREGRFVPSDQFSDSEQIITYAAMSIALAATAEFKVVIVDELTRVRGERKADIVQRMLELIEEGVIDQFFGVDVETDDGQVPEYYKRAGLEIIHIK